MSLGQYMASFRSILKEWDKDKSGHRDKDPLIKFFKETNYD